MQTFIPGPVVQLPCCLNKQGELWDNILQTLRNSTLPPRPVAKADRPNELAEGREGGNDDDEGVENILSVPSLAHRFVRCGDLAAELHNKFALSNGAIPPNSIRWSRSSMVDGRGRGYRRTDGRTKFEKASRPGR